MTTPALAQDDVVCGEGGEEVWAVGLVRAPAGELVSQVQIDAGPGSNLYVVRVNLMFGRSSHVWEAGSILIDGPATAFVDIEVPPAAYVNDLQQTALSQLHVVVEARDPSGATLIGSQSAPWTALVWPGGPATTPQLLDEHEALTLAPRGVVGEVELHVIDDATPIPGVPMNLVEDLPVTVVEEDADQPAAAGAADTGVL